MRKFDSRCWFWIASVRLKTTIRFTGRSVPKSACHQLLVVLLVWDMVFDAGAPEVLPSMARDASWPP